MKRITLVAILAGLALGACGEKLESISQVTKFRILAVQTDPPEVTPGETTTIRALVADPEGNDRMIVAGGMVMPGTMTPTSGESIEEPPPLFWQLDFSVAAPNGVVDLGDLGIPSYYLDENGQQVSLLTNEEDSLSATAIILLCAGDGFTPAAMWQAVEELFDAEEGEIGLEDPNALKDLCVEAGADEGLVAFKTFDITLNTTNPNTNPVIDRLQIKPKKKWISVLPWVDGGDPGTFSLEGDECRDLGKIRAFLTEDSFQQYDKEQFGNIETVDERTYISWFTDGGEFDVDRSGNNGEPDDPYRVDWLPPRECGQHHLWAVAHDIRGGVSWERYMLDAVLEAE